MATITFHSHLQPISSQPEYYSYSIAGHTLLAPFRWQHMAPTEVGRKQFDATLPLTTMPEVTFSGSLQLGGRNQYVVYRADSACSCLSIDSVGDFIMDAAGTTIQHVGGSPQMSEVELARAFFCLPFALALAVNKTWCLRTSALFDKTHTFAFVGEPDSVVRTTVGALASFAGWQIVTNDLLPVALDDAGQIQAFPYPQFSVSNTNRPAAGLRRSLSQAALYHVLPAVKSAASPAPALKPLSWPQTLLLLAQYTAGAALFSSNVQAEHTAFCIQLAQTLPVRQLAVDIGMSGLAQLTELLTADVKQLPNSLKRRPNAQKQH